MKKLSATILTMFFAVSIYPANASLLAIESQDIEDIITDPSEITDEIVGTDPADSEGPTSFSDVDFSNPYADSIEWMQRNKIVSGYADGTFGVDKCVSRVEFLKMLYEVQGVEIEEGTINTGAKLFNDVPNDAWYTAYVQEAKELGTVNGYPNGKFKPAQCVTRAEAAKIATLSFNDNQIPVVPAEGYSSDSPSYMFMYTTPTESYSDIPETAWHYPYMDYTISSNTIGTNHTWGNYDYNYRYRFLPNDSMTRQEATEILYRMKTVKDYEEDIYITGQHPVIEEDNLFYTNCNTDSAKVGNNPDALAAIPSSAELVMGIDHSDTTQLANIKSVLSALSENGVWDEMIQEYDAAAEPAMDYVNLDPILSEDWEMVLGVSFGDYLTNPNSLDNPEVFIVGKFEKADDFEKYIGRLIANEMNYYTTCEKKDGVTYWTSETDEFYFARYGKVFFVTNTKEGREKAITRLEGNKVFPLKNNYSSGKLAYIYLDGKVISSLGSTFAGVPDLNYLYQLVGGLGDLYGSISADSGGIIMSASADVADQNNTYIKNYVWAQPVFVNKVPAKDIILYAEDPDFSTLIEALEYEYDYSYYYSETSSSESYVMSEIGKEIGATTEETEALMTSPFAFAVNDSGSFVPAISFYLKFTSSEKATAEKLVSTLDKYVDEEIALESSVTITKSVTTSGLTKIVFDVESMEATYADDIAMKESLLKSGLELYYGILDNDTLVIALFPNFEEHYGVNPLSQDSTYKTAVEKLNGIYGGKLSYLNVANTMTLIQHYIDLTNDSEYPLIGEEDLTAFKNIMNTFKYLISSTKTTSTTMDSRTYVRMGK